MNRIQTLQRISDADKLLEIRKLYAEFTADDDMRHALQFCRSLAWAVGTCLLLYGLAWVVLTQ